MGKLVQGLQGQSLHHRGKQSVKGSGETVEQRVLREQDERDSDPGSWLGLGCV